MVKIIKPQDFKSNEEAIDYVTNYLYSRYENYTEFGQIQFKKVDDDNTYKLTINKTNVLMSIFLNKNDLDNELNDLCVKCIDDFTKIIF